MDYLTVKEAGIKWGVTARMVNNYCLAGRISGAMKKVISGSYRLTLKSRRIREKKEQS